MSGIHAATSMPPIQGEVFRTGTSRNRSDGHAVKSLAAGCPAGEVIHLTPVQPVPTGREVLIRPARTADAPAVQAFVRRLSPETRRKRFFGPIVELSPEQLERLTSRACADDLNLLGLDRCREIVGMAQCVATGRRPRLSSPWSSPTSWQRRGIGTALCSALFQHARERRLARLGGFVLTENRAMLGFRRQARVLAGARHRCDPHARRHALDRPAARIGPAPARG